MKTKLSKLSAFTLIELLVVISIIAILAGIALPVYNKVMEKSRATSCASNLKQLGLGVATFLSDNDEQIFTDLTTGDKVWPKVLQEKYVTNWKVFRCPFDIKPRDAASAGLLVSYGINENILSQPGKPGWDGNFSKLVASSQLILMAPAMTSDPATPKFVGTSNQNVSLPMPTSGTVKLGTHNGRSQINVLFADSHVSSIPYLPASNPEAFTSNKPESTGSLSGVIVKWQPVKP